MINLKWCVKTIREIASPENQGGYTKLIQISLILLLCTIFVIIFFYYLFDKGMVNKIDIILTVIVGWLGAIIGRFFGERAMETLEEKRQLSAKKADFLIEKYYNLLTELRKLKEK